MNRYRADLHVHTVLSPCGDLEMSPSNIVKRAALKGIDILGVTDHNSTKHGALIRKLAEKEGIFVLCGAEVTTREEIHCLAFFENDDTLEKFQQYLDTYLADVWNNPSRFGYQVVVDENDMIVEEVNRLLIAAIDQSIDEVEEEVHALGGLFIPAHIDRPSHSLISQLGFMPPGLKVDALEVTGRTTPEDMVSQFPELAPYSFIGSSDAHFPEQLGTRMTVFEMETRSFAEIKKALHREDGRRVSVLTDRSRA
ncbi:MAG: PHP domain-containing protein [Bacteroidia bacterium]|nr:MAG: PHP domain-containing protein [Bacteroidia bacterium]